MTLIRYALLLAAGLATGAVGAVVQTHTLDVGVSVPTGALLALGTLVPMARAAAWWVRSRLGAVVFAAGWLALTLAMGTTTPAGDLVLSSGTRQVAYLVVGTMLLSAACGFPLLPADDELAAEDTEATADA